MVIRLYYTVLRSFSSLQTRSLCMSKAMGKVEPFEQKIERIVSDKRRGLQRTQRQKEQETQK